MKILPSLSFVISPTARPGFFCRLSRGCLGLLLLGVGPHLAQAITYPPLTSFLYGNSSVDQVGKTALVSGTGMPYRYSIPKNYDPAKKYQVVIFLHGDGQKGTDNVKQLSAGGNTANGALALVSTANPDNQTAFPCFFVAPQTTGWGAARAPEILAIVNTLKKYYSIDEDRICLTGLSGGALGTWPIVNALPNTFASLVPQMGGGGSVVSTLERIPLWAFHAENDTTVVCNSTDVTISAYRARGFPAIYTRYHTGGHGIPSVAYQHPQLMAWISAQRRGQVMQGVPALTITASSLGASPLTISGTSATTDPSLSFTRIGWSCSTNGGTPGGSDGVTNGTTTFTSAKTTFSAATHVGYRIAIHKNMGKTTSPFLYDIVAVVNANTVILDRASSAETARSFTLYKPGTNANLNPAAGTGAPTWNSWSVSVPVITGTNLAQVIAEAPTGSGLGGRTTCNQPLPVVFASPLGDTVVPVLTVSNPSVSPLSTTSSTITLAGSAFDNVGVTSVTWSSDRGTSGSASGTSSWAVANVRLSPGLNTIVVTARDANNNAASAHLKVTYAPASGADTTPPAIAITSPTSAATHSTTTSSVSLGGTVSDNTGVVSVVWSNTTTATHGPAVGTSSWTASGIGLAPGTNEIVVIASDAAGNTSTDTLAVTYNPPIKKAPLVASGGSQTITLPTTAGLAGTASDDGLPSGALVTTWSTVSGPGTVIFGNAGTLATTATFPVEGVYVLRLTASDGVLFSTSDMTVTVNAAIPPLRIRYDFGQTIGLTTTPGWNNIADPFAGSVAASVDVHGVTTGIGLAIVTAFAGTNDNGTAIPAGIYEPSAMRDFVYSQASAGKVRFSGLKPSSTYKVILYGYRMVTVADRVSKYTIGSMSKTLNAAQNLTNTAVFTGVAPAANGTMDVTVDREAGSTYGYLGVLEIEEEVDGTAAPNP